MLDEVCCQLGAEPGRVALVVVESPARVDPAAERDPVAIAGVVITAYALQRESRSGPPVVEVPERAKTDRLVHSFQGTVAHLASDRP